jgi:hypothetical protein
MVVAVLVSLLLFVLFYIGLVAASWRSRSGSRENSGGAPRCTSPRRAFRTSFEFLVQGER